MGLFTQGPEETDEWAGIPSDPDRTESIAERLPGSAPLSLAGLLGAESGMVESIVIPVAPVIEIVEPLESGEGDPDD